MPNGHKQPGHNPFDAAEAPTNINYDRASATLHLTYQDGQTHDLSTELLRVESPSAEVQGHGPDQKQIVPGKKNVKITGIEPVGRYAVRIIFDDGHDTGLYSWRYFRDLIAQKEKIWATYLNGLNEQGLSRD